MIVFIDYTKNPNVTHEFPLITPYLEP